MPSAAHVPAAEQLRAAVSVLRSAAADRHRSTADVVSVRPHGLQLGNDPHLLDAATVHMAARGVVGALLDHLVHSTGRDFSEVADLWLLSLAGAEALADVADHDVA